MATSEATTSATPEADSAVDALMRIEDGSDSVDRMLALLTWIEAARQLISNIQNAAEIDESLRARLSDHDVRLNLSMDDAASGALVELLGKMMMDVRGIGVSAHSLRLEPAMARGASHV